MQLSSESLQELATAIEWLACQALVRLPECYIQKEAAYAFIDGVKDQEVKQHLFMGIKRMPSTRP
jgi:hypothetical protein